MAAHWCQAAHIEAGEEHSEVSSFLLPHGSWGIKLKLLGLEASTLICCAISLAQYYRF